MTELEKLKAGRHFRNGDYPDAGNRYKLRLGMYGLYNIIRVGDPYFDIQGHESPHYVKRFDGDVVVCGQVIREMEGIEETLTFPISTLIFDEIP